MNAEKRMILRLCRALIRERARALRLADDEPLPMAISAAEDKDAELDLLNETGSVLKAAQDLIAAKMQPHLTGQK